MKLLKITTFYPEYLNQFYSRHSCLAEEPFAKQKAIIDYDAFGWADYWSQALKPLNYDVWEITMNAEPLQRAWARENDLNDFEIMDLKRIVLEQVKRFQPDILWFDDCDSRLLQQIRSENPNISLVLGWTGSAIPKTDVWFHMDLVLSCAPESLTFLKQRGVAVAHLHHGFDPRLSSRLRKSQKVIDLSFVGQLIRGNQFHLQREFLLEQLASQMKIEIFSPSADFGWREDLKGLLMAGIHKSINMMKSVGLSEGYMGYFNVLQKAALIARRPIRSVNPKLKKFIKPAVFGIEMFQVLRDSKVTLNVHADSSPLFASNMRLFEITGLGSCMVTDSKENLHELFEPDKEIVVYQSIDECVEKVQWLLEHDREREEIATAGRLRTLKDHTFACRAIQLDDIVKKKLKGHHPSFFKHS